MANIVCSLLTGTCGPEVAKPTEPLTTMQITHNNGENPDGSEVIHIIAGVVVGGTLVFALGVVASLIFYYFVIKKSKFILH